ncbi:hypothetical protein M9H77_15103 [Catharanthus roseus]|uniref:Uncharacterized protein n=1 Tax=Catharanthus roseus TaxID=4058 RepID=A0ACC0BQ77_CATRO|nr:hypothetical protein M9H77_15103 [Catharanthus roseus]
MSSFLGVLVSDQWLQSQFTQVELRYLKSKFTYLKNQNGKVTIGDLPSLLVKFKAFSEMFNEVGIKYVLEESYPDMSTEVDFESFLKAYLKVQSQASRKLGSTKNSSSFLKATTTTLLHTISESEKSSYVAHINSYLRDDPFLKRFFPIDPATNALFDFARDGVLLCKLINVAVPGTIDERAINMKRVLNPWERNENHTLCLNSAKAIGCTVVNIGTQDLVEGRIQLLADLNLKKTPQLVELVADNDVEELMGLAPEKVLLKWMNFHLQKAGYKKTVTNFTSDVKDGEAYAYLLNVLAPEHCSPATLDAKDPAERANLVLEHAERMDCKRYLTPKDIVEGSANLNLAFVAQIFHQSRMHVSVRNGLSTDNKKISFAEMMPHDEQVSREERCFRLWINSLGIASYINNLFEDVRNGFQLAYAVRSSSFSSYFQLGIVGSAGKDFSGICQLETGNKTPLKDAIQKSGKLQSGRRNWEAVETFLAFLWQLMRFNILQLLKNLRSRFQGKGISDADILRWANKKVKSTGRSSQMESFKDKSLSNGLFFLELLSAVEPRVVNWNLVTKGESDEEKKLNATYIISVARKLGCSIFLLPEDIIEVNQKMILTLTASIMYWSLQQTTDDSESSPSPVSSKTPDESHRLSINGSPSPILEDVSDASPGPSFNGSASPMIMNTPEASPAPSISGSLSPSAAASPSESPAPSINGDDEPLGCEVSNLSIDDAASDSTSISSEIKNEETHKEQVEMSSSDRGGGGAGGSAGMVVSDQDIVEALESLLRDNNPNNPTFTSLNGIVQHLESKLGLNLSHKIDFIRSRIQLLFQPPQPQQQPPLQLQKDHFALHQNPNFHSHHLQFHSPGYVIPHPHEYGFRPPQQHQQLQQQPQPQPPQHVVVPSPAVPSPAVAPEAPKERRSLDLLLLHVLMKFSFDFSAPTGKKRRGGPGGLNKLCGVSPQLQTIVGQATMPRTEIVKQLWAYIRKNNLQDPNNKRKIICNDELRLVFETDCTDMFKMNKLLAKHISPLEATKQPAQTAKRTKTEVESGSETANSVPIVVISEALANFFGIGEREMSQAEDPLNSMAILCDTKLQELFGCENSWCLVTHQILTSSEILTADVWWLANFSSLVFGGKKKERKKRLRQDLADVFSASGQPAGLNSIVCKVKVSELAECLPAIAGNSPPKPTKECCDVLKKADLHCLCRHKSDLSKFGANPAKALELPKKCGLKAPQECQTKH